MTALTRRAFTLSTIVCLIVALATFGGYRLAGSSGPGRPHLRLAGTVLSTWVSGTGLDSNAASPSFCQRGTPCKSFQTAYGVTAPGGVLAAADAGPFAPLSISETITVDGGSGKGWIQSFADGIDVNAGPSDVVILRHLQINGVGDTGRYGISFTGGKALILDDVTIEGFSQHGIFVRAPGPASVTITNSHIQSNGGAGIAIAPSGGTVQVNISHSLVAGNYFGVTAQDGADVSLTDSVVTGSTSIGVGCQTYGNGACTIQTAHDRLDHNWAAVWMNHAAGNGQITESLSDDDIFSNSYGIYGDVGGTLNAASTGNNRFMNNFQDGAASSTMTEK